MVDYKDFDKAEIRNIAENIENYYPKGKEMKLWYDYKKAVMNFLEDADFWENHSKQDNEVVQSIIADINEAREELAWIRSIKTFDVTAYCKYFKLNNEEFDGHLQKDILYLMADRLVKGDIDEQVVRELFEESNYLNSILNWKVMNLPVAKRHWGHWYNNPSEYYPTETPADAVELYDGREHYVYVESENVARWGESYWISVDCENTLMSLPVIKDFKEYEFEVGKFYKIQCTDTIKWGNNKKKYVMSIEESTEEEFLEKGLIQYATRW